MCVAIHLTNLDIYIRRKPETNFTMMLEKFPSRTQGGKICDSCRKQLAQIPVESNLDESCDDDVDSSYTCQQDQLESINE